MKIKYLLPILCFALSALCGVAESLYLHIQKSDGTWEVLSLDKVDRLTFDNGKMVASDATGNEVANFDAADLTTLQVNETEDEVNDYTSLGSVARDTNGFSFDAATATVVFNGEQKGAFEIYDASGKRLVNITDYRSGQTVKIAALEAGVYILKLGDNTKKIAVK